MYAVLCMYIYVRRTNDVFSAPLFPGAGTGIIQLARGTGGTHTLFCSFLNLQSHISIIGALELEYIEAQERGRKEGKDHQQYSNAE